MTKNNEQSPDPGAILTLTELAAYLKISHHSLYRMAARGSIPGAKVGRHWRFPRTLIDQWLEDSGRQNLARGADRG